MHMKVRDWADDGWLNFVADFSLDPERIPRAQLLDMKEAWLHGARTALAQASATINASIDEGKDAESLSEDEA
jgi:hypothetical protein